MKEPGCVFKIKCLEKGREKLAAAFGLRWQSAAATALLHEQLRRPT
jgi:hypothetical protein